MQFQAEYWGVLLSGIGIAAVGGLVGWLFNAPDGPVDIQAAKARYWRKWFLAASALSAVAWIGLSMFDLAWPPTSQPAPDIDNQVIITPDGGSVWLNPDSGNSGGEGEVRQRGPSTQSAADYWSPALLISFASLLVSVSGAVSTTVLALRADRRAQREHEWKKSDRETAGSPCAPHSAA